MIVFITVFHSKNIKSSLKKVICNLRNVSLERGIVWLFSHQKLPFSIFHQSKKICAFSCRSIRFRKNITHCIFCRISFSRFLYEFAHKARIVTKCHYRDFAIFEACSCSKSIAETKSSNQIFGKPSFFLIIFFWFT